MTSIDPGTFRGWHRLPGASPESLARLALELGRVLPSAYLELLREMNGGEGFLAETYLRLYPCDQVAALNRAYAVAEWLPGHVLIGSDGGGMAYLLAPDDAIAEVPFIPMDARYLTRRIPDLVTFLQPVRPGAEPPRPNPDCIGMEIHEVQPVLFGGDPCDPGNRVTLSQEEHATVVVRWNRKFHEMAPQTEV